MPRLQELIHALELGAGVRYLRLAALVLGVATMAIIYDLREFQNFHSEESMDAAQLARNIAEGRGFTTRYIRPLSIGLIMRHRPDRDPQIKGEHPDLANPPVYPLVLAGFMKIPGLFIYDIHSPKEGQFRRYQPDFMIAIMNQCFFFVALALTWRLARRLFEARVAVITTLVMLGSDMLWRFSASGQSTMLAIALFMALANVLYELDAGAQREPPRGQFFLLSLAVAAGVLCGLLAMTRFSFGILVVPTVAYLVWVVRGRALLVPLAAAVVFLAVASPWWVRNAQICGNPLGLAAYSVFQNTDTFPLNSLERTMEPNISMVGSSDITRKAFVAAAQLAKVDLPQLGGSWLTAFFLVGMLVPFIQPSRTRLRWFSLVALVLLGIVQVLGRTHLSDDTPVINSENLLVLVSPLIFMFGAALLVLLVFSLEVTVEAWRSVILGAMVGVFWIPLLISFGPPRTTPIAYPPYYPPIIRPLEDWFAPNELIMSDMPWAIAWYANRQSVLLTRTPDKDFMQLNDWQKTVNGLYLSRLTMDQHFISGWLLNAREWGRFMMDTLHKSEVPDGFPLAKSPNFLSMFPHYLLYADRARWDTMAPAKLPKNLDPKKVPESQKPEHEHEPEHEQKP